MFEGEAYTAEALLEAVLNRAPDGVDTRPGSIFYDAVAAIVDQNARFYADLDIVSSMTLLDTAEDEALDLKAADYGLTRRAAVPARYSVTFTGAGAADLEPGDRFYSDGIYFILLMDEAGQYFLEAEEPGEAGNSIYAGSPAVPVENYDDLESATFGPLIRSGSDMEDDESFRARIKEKISGPAENGNLHQYKTWCESVEGVGRAFVFPLWNGPNSVKAILIDPTGSPCSADVVGQVQTFIDPATKGYTATVDGRAYTVGDGLGEGVASIGAHFTAAAAQPLAINITAKVYLASGSSSDQAAGEVRAAVTQYLRQLTFQTSDHADIIVRYNSIGARIATCESILDYSDLLINGGTDNITPATDDVAITGEVLLNVL